MLPDRPLFPLQTVLFPGGVLPLRIFETRYIDMVRDCLRESQGLVVVALRAGSEIQQAVHFADLGTYAEVVDWEQRPEGLLGIVVQGRQRVRIQAPRQQTDGLWRGDLAPLEEWPDVEAPVAYASMVDLLQRLLEQLGPPWSDMPQRLQDAAWVAGRLTELMPLETDLKQEILETDDPLERLTRLRAAMLALANP